MVYKISADDFKTLGDIGYNVIKKKKTPNKTKYKIIENEVLIHESAVYKKLFFLRIINKVGPAIGDCFTNPDYRGKSIYPLMLNKISKELLFQKKYREVFVIVDHDNINSIKGIEKAGFKLFSKIKTTRFLFFYLNTKITN